MGVAVLAVATADAATKVGKKVKKKEQPELGRYIIMHKYYGSCPTEAMR